MEPVSKADLVLILKEMTERVEIGDSFEGYLNYLIPDPVESGETTAEGEPVYTWEEGHDFDVEACFRVGNLDGQGGMKMIGVTFDSPRKPNAYAVEPQVKLQDEPLAQYQPNEYKPFKGDVTELTDLVDSLRHQLAICSSERSDSAAYAVRLQDEIGDLTTERRKILQGLRHLWHHLQNKEGIGAVIEVPGDSCGEIHPLLKQYLV